MSDMVTASYVDGPRMGHQAEQGAGLPRVTGLMRSRYPKPVGRDTVELTPDHDDLAPFDDDFPDEESSDA